MNTIIIEGRITRLTDHQNALGIQVQEEMFGNTNKYSTRIIGTSYERWKGLLDEGDLIKFQGSIAEAKIGSCGAYMVVYNPEILDAYKTKRERIEPENARAGKD